MAAKWPRLSTNSHETEDKSEWVSTSETRMPCGKVVEQSVKGRNKKIAEAMSERLAKAKGGQHLRSHDCK